ncbi:MAG: glycosyltransferase family 4 protein [Candidatus Nealsonbacteria bacterium]|nr:glycosyltransferase family 4 protein [Candidatus Nealsonbacteria bacterium]
MKILFLNDSVDVKSGIGRYAWEIIRRVKERGAEVIVLTRRKSDLDFVKQVLPDTFSSKGIFSPLRKIRRYAKQCDIIHAFDGYPYGVIGALAGIGLKKRLVINGVGTYSVLPLEQFPIKNLLKWAYKKADKILCISNFTQKEILKRIKLNNIEVVNLGVDCGRFAGAPRLRSGQASRIILSVGALKPRKGYHVAIRAVAKAKEKYPDIKYHIVGDQSHTAYFSKLKELSKNLGLEENIFFWQNIEDEELIGLYGKADIFLLTPINIENNFEGFGLVYLEANASGLPVIGSSDCGAEDIIKDNYNGLLAPQNDVENTAKAIIKLFDNQDFAKKLGENGMAVAKEMNWDKTVDQYFKVYKSIL